MLTPAQLQSIMPRLTPKQNRELLPFLQAAMTEFGIESPARAAAFLAQLAHESGQFRFMEEIWGPTDAQRRYEPVSTLSARLGNTEPGDGKRFKGRGPIQLTGRDNYRRFGDLLGVDLVADPPKAALPDVAFRVAGLFWSKKQLNELADRATDDAFREITTRINGGINGLAERLAFYATARKVLGVADALIAPAATPRSFGVSPPAAEPAFDRGTEAIREDRPERPAARRRPKPRKATRRPVKKTRGAKKRSKKKAAAKRRR